MSWMMARLRPVPKLAGLTMLAGIALIGLSGVAQADTDQERRDALQGLYRLLVQQEICEFAVSDAHSDALEKSSGALEEALKLGEADIDKLYKETEAGVKKQNAKALCDPNGEAVKAYDKAMAELGK